MGQVCRLTSSEIPVKFAISVAGAAFFVIKKTCRGLYKRVMCNAPYGCLLTTVARRSHFALPFWLTPHLEDDGRGVQTIFIQELGWCGICWDFERNLAACFIPWIDGGM